MTRAIFQSGFSWKVIEAKWPGFEEAFDGFDVAVRPGDGAGVTYDALADLGVTWCLSPLNPGVTEAEVRAAAATAPQDWFTA